MAITFAQLQDLMKKTQYPYYIAPDQPVVRFAVAGMFGRYEIVIPLQDDGSFLQFRTVGYLRCPPDHPHLTAVLQALAGINYEKRFVKFAWDSAQGEVACYGDAWVMDNQVTQEQFDRMLNTFLPAIDVSYPRIKTALDTGSDPGNQDPQLAAAQALGSASAGIPPELRELLDKLKKKDSGKPTDGPTTGEKPEIKEI